jgi:hypothetical protein
MVIDREHLQKKKVQHERTLHCGRIEVRGDPSLKEPVVRNKYTGDEQIGDQMNKHRPESAVSQLQKVHEFR